MKNSRFSFIRYANCWEDSDTLCKALNIGREDIGLSVTSGGDNTFALLLQDPKKIYAFDVNKTQEYCMELKIAAFRSLSYNEVLRFFGVLGSNKRKHTFQTLKKYLSKEAVDYFSENMGIIEKGIIHSGKFENYFAKFRKYIAPFFCGSKRLKEFCELESIREQKKFYAKYIDNLRFKAIFKLYFGVKLMARFGRDNSFYKYVDDKKSQADDIKKRFEYGISHTINKKNPYLSYILKGNFSEYALPEYLKKENFKKIKSDLDKIVLINSDLLSLDKELKFDFLNLSDIFEYISKEEFEKNTDKLMEICNDNARIAYWNMQNRRYLRKKDFYLHKEKSVNLFRENKSFFYRNFLVYSLKER